ncbi:Type VII secretion system protein EccCa1 (plasmid) [Tsukamurella tyrosinosolvens]|uniref:ATPase family associated with various cellular activities (AAA) n=1 Tax=Tsukamurella tyrosinosolvens TaxID=57704 RepID=A0A1H4U9X2_TSUTY|nr:FtsK/SpoIIIE domain-containing protein [Tsukamurella tyrosinosolvens]KXO92987.1 hypothetical protein AXK58_14045 [Tsukamurella tyrosinosolvens]SEC65539.1 ATPase family associated with various cellular activities (AAA) [Tsukamurella tyrosinosolvens]VEH94081.1 Type VII secretion system protein EccCa1 [Tsukamurella tyrosinosolvens]
MVQSSRLKKLAREHMAAHPEVKYQQALAAVTAADATAPPPPGGPGTSIGGDGPHVPNFLEALGITDLATNDFEAVWARNSATGSLRAPIGYLRRGDEILPELNYLDMLEENLGGDGPHGGIAGRTGSGKSYFLRSILLSLVSLYGPDDIALLLADFKGGSTFLGFDRLPHTVAALSGLEQSNSLIERFAAVVDGEVTRREEFITGQKGCADIHAYRRKQRENPNDPNWPALPHLVIVVDEFGDYLRHRSAFLDMLLRTARVGRSLGVHLVLASQYLDSGNAAELLPSLSFGYCLAVNHPAHSRAMIGTDAAANMIHSRQTMGKALRRLPADPAPVEVVAFNHEAPLPGDGPHTGDDARDNMAQALIARLAALDVPRVPAMWTDPLDVPRTFADEPALEEEKQGLKIRIGVLDAPRRHETLPWILDFTGQRPHYAIAGGPKSGRSTTLRTMVLASAVTHADGRVAFMLLDGHDRSLSAVAEAPNVAAHVAAGDDNGVRAVLAEVDRLIEMRTAAMAVAGHHVVDQYLGRKDSDSDDPYGYVVVAIDGIGTFLGDGDRRAQADRLLNIIERGHTVGVHLVFTADSAASGSTGNVPHYSMEVPGVVQLWSTSYAGTRMPAELRLTLDSLIPERQPGRSFDPVTMLQARILLPIDRGIDPDGTDHGVRRYAIHDRTDEIGKLSASLAEGNPASRVPVVEPGAITASARAKQKKDIVTVRAEIDAIIGQDAVKKELHALLGAAEVEMELRRRGLPLTRSASRNLVLAGAPGIGKSHLAGLIGRILQITGRLSTGKVTRATRASLVGTHIGETGARTQAVLDKAHGGVLFIDDAYDLAREQDEQIDLFGREALDALRGHLERDPDDLAVVIAGYAPLVERFLEENALFASHFGTRITFEAFTDAQLWEHLLNFAECDGRSVHPSAEEPFRSAVAILDVADRKGDRLIDVAGNLRFVRNVYEVALGVAAQRLSTSEDLSALSDAEMLLVTEDDVSAAVCRVLSGFGLGLSDAA